MIIMILSYYDAMSLYSCHELAIIIIINALLYFINSVYFMTRILYDSIISYTVTVVYSNVLPEEGYYRLHAAIMSTLKIWFKKLVERGN